MDIQLARLPAVGAPGGGKDVSWSPLFELRLVQGNDAGGTGWGSAMAGGHAGRVALPAEAEDLQRPAAGSDGPADLGEEQAVHAAALAYASDSGPAWMAEPARTPKAPRRSPGDRSASTTRSGSIGPSGATGGSWSRPRPARCTTRVG